MPTCMAEWLLVRDSCIVWSVTAGHASLTQAPDSVDEMSSSLLIWVKFWAGYLVQFIWHQEANRYKNTKNTKQLIVH